MDQSSVLKKLVKRGLDQLQHVQVAGARLLGLIDFPVPPNSSMRKTSSRSIRHYYRSGIRTTLPIATCARRERVALDGDIRILDFGCGVGRQLLHFTRHFPKPAYFACDIDDTSIRFIRKHYPQVTAVQSAFHPPLEYPDGFFDMVYSVSIFSHLSLEDHGPWLDELARVTRPGGTCFLTFEGETALRSLAPVFGRDPERLIEELRERGALYKEYSYLKKSVQTQNTLRTASHLVGVTGSYGNTVLSSEHIRTAWNTDRFEVIEILEGVIDYRQDLAVLRRR